MKNRAVIAGFGHTAFGRLPGRDSYSLNAEACAKALADAGIEKDRVDGLFAKVPTSKVEFMYGQKLAEALGLMPKVGGVWDQGGASNISMISFAAMAIEHGQCEVALVTLADNPKSGTTQAYDKAWGEDAVYGWFSVAAGYAMLSQRHSVEYGTKAEDLGAVAVACRRHGAANPDAQLRKAITLDDYMASPWIIEPFRRDDICLVSDGAAAVIVTSAKKAKELGIDFRSKFTDTGDWYSNMRVGEDCAAVKMLIDNQTDEIVGAHLFGPEYAELINIFGLAIKSGMKTADLKRMISAYPSVGSDLASMI